MMSGSLWNTASMWLLQVCDIMVCWSVLYYITLYCIALHYYIIPVYLTLQYIVLIDHMINAEVPAEEPALAQPEDEEGRV